MLSMWNAARMSANNFQAQFKLLDFDPGANGNCRTIESWALGRHRLSQVKPCVRPILNMFTAFVLPPITAMGFKEYLEALATGPLLSQHTSPVAATLWKTA